MICHAIEADGRTVRAGDRRREVGARLDVRKTEYVVRSNSAPLPQWRSRNGRRRSGPSRGSQVRPSLRLPSVRPRFAIPGGSLPHWPWRLVLGGVAGGLALLLVLSAVVFD